MERGLRAFFYDYHYYLFPDGMTLGELYDLIIEDTYDRDRR